jgi:hypothetical protein
MANLEQPAVPEATTEELLERYNAIARMPEAALEEAKAKLQAYNDAIIALEARLGTIRHESMSGSLDDGSQEEAADVRERDLLAPAIVEFREQLGRLHDRILKLSGQRA